MHYDAVAVGRNDLAAGLSFLQNQAERAQFTWLSANLVRKSNKKPLFSASLIRQVGSLSIGIIGLTDYDGTIRFEENEDALFLPPGRLFYRNLLLLSLSNVISLSCFQITDQIRIGR